MSLTRLNNRSVSAVTALPSGIDIPAGVILHADLPSGSVLQIFNTSISETSISNGVTTTMFNVSFTPKKSGSTIVGYANWNSTTGPGGANAGRNNYAYYNLGTSSTPSSNTLIQTTSLQHLGDSNDHNLSHLHIFKGTTSSTSNHYISGRIYNGSGGTISVCRHSNTGPIIFFEIA
jgi:hypothetical protein